MTPSVCPREREVIELVAIGQWPPRANDDLRAHVASCEACAETALVARAMADADEPRDVRVPDAGIVWLRAQLAARDEARRRAARPLWLAQVAAAVVLVAGAGAWWSGASGWLTHAMGTMWAGATNLLPSAAWIASASDASASAPSGATARWALGALLAGILVLPLALGLSRLADHGDES